MQFQDSAVNWKEDLQSQPSHHHSFVTLIFHIFCIFSMKSMSKVLVSKKTHGEKLNRIKILSNRVDLWRATEIVLFFFFFWHPRTSVHPLRCPIVLLRMCALNCEFLSHKVWVLFIPVFHAQQREFHRVEILFKYLMSERRREEGNDWVSETTWAQTLSHIQLFATPLTVAHQAPMFMDSPGKNTGVSCHFLLQGIFSTQGSNLCLLHWQVDSLL